MSERMSGWEATNEAIAQAVRAYRGDRRGLIDHLAYALEESCIQFPIMEMGEELDDICPFTFFASFSRPMPDERRERLVSLVCDALGVEAAVPASFEGYPTVEDYQARFFSHNRRNEHREIEALWDLFEVALEYARVAVEAQEGQGSEVRLTQAEDALAAAYDRVGSVRTAGFRRLPVALAWIFPRVFLPLASLAASDDEPAAHGTDCVSVLRGAHETRAERVDHVGAGTGTTSECDGPAPARPHAPEPGQALPCVPSLDPELTDRLLDAYAEQLSAEALAELHPNVWQAVCCFQQNWDEGADDFAAMLERSLACHDGLLCTGYFYNPHKEAMVFARKEPELTRQAFCEFFGQQRPVEERIVRFERTMSAMFERHRGDIVSAMPRRSSHGNYLACCTYLFLRHPDTCHLFSPSKLRVLDKMCGYGCSYRLAKPECVTQYFTLCDAICERLVERKELQAGLLTRADEALANFGWRDAEVDAPVARTHVLVDDIAWFACELEKTQRAQAARETPDEG